MCNQEAEKLKWETALAQICDLKTSYFNVLPFVFPFMQQGNGEERIKWMFVSIAW